MESRSRFSSINSLVLLRSKLDELNTKCDNLKASIQSIFNFMSNKSLMQLKYNLLIALTEGINKLITQFNNEPRIENELNEKAQIIKLIAALNDLVYDFIILNRDTLNKPTSSAKSIGENVVYYSGKMATFGGLYATGGLSILPAAIGWYGSSKITSSLNSQLGFSEEYTSTMNLLNDLQNELEKVFNFFHHDLLYHGLQPQVGIKRRTHEDLITMTTRVLDATMNWALSSSSATHNNTEINNYSAATKSYIENIKKENLLQEITALELNDVEQVLFEKFKDPITHGYMNIPVRLDDQVFDLETLLKISIREDGKRRTPFKNFPFSLCHIQSDLNIANEMKEAISKIKQQRAPNTKQEVQASLPSNMVQTLRNSGSPLHQSSNENIQQPEQEVTISLNQSNRH